MRAVVAMRRFFTSSDLRNENMRLQHENAALRFALGASAREEEKRVVLNDLACAKRLAEINRKFADQEALHAAKRAAQVLYIEGFLQGLWPFDMELVK